MRLSNGEQEILRESDGSGMENDWQTPGIKNTSKGASTSDRTDVPQDGGRPFAILLLALFQICKGIVVAGVMFIFLLMPQADITSSIGVKVATFILARQNLGSPIVLITLPLAAMYLCVSGFALLRLKQWARNAMMLTSGATVLMWARRLYFDHILGTTTLKTFLQQQSVYAVMCVDAIIFLCLASYSDAFRESR
jgi:hypothetical protein